MARDRSLLRRITRRRRSHLRLGKPDVSVDLPSRTRGVKQGNSIGNYEKQPGHLPDGKSTAECSTGIAEQWSHSNGDLAWPGRPCTYRGSPVAPSWTCPCRADTTWNWLR